MAHEEKLATALRRAGKVPKADTYAMQENDFVIPAWAVRRLEARAKARHGRQRSRGRK